MSLGQYAKDVNRSYTTISVQANGYAAWVEGERSRPLSDEITLANMGVERQAATEAVAKATGKSVNTMRAGQNRKEVTEVLHTARDRAERNKTTVGEEVVTYAAQHIAKCQRIRMTGWRNDPDLRQPRGFTTPHWR